MSTIRFMKEGAPTPLGYEPVAHFDEGAYVARGSARQMEMIRNLIDDVFGAGRASGIADASIIQLTPAEREALTA
ncbi:hypothetical protein D3C87_1575440 [compost metagenome]